MTNKDFMPQEVEAIIKRTCGSFAVDGMVIDDDMKDRARRILRGQITGEEAVQEIIFKLNAGGYDG